MDSKYHSTRQVVSASMITSSKLPTQGVAYFAPQFSHPTSRYSATNTSSSQSYHQSSDSSSLSRNSYPSPRVFGTLRSKSASPGRTTRDSKASRPSNTRSRSAPVSSRTEPSCISKSRSPKPKIGLASEANLQDRKDEINIQMMLIPQKTWMDITIALITTSLTYLSTCLSITSYFPQTREDVNHAWRSWRAGYRIRRQPFTQPKPTISLYTSFTQWLAPSFLRLSTFISTPSRIAPQHHHQHPVYVPSSDSPIATRAKGRKISMEPPPKSLSPPPRKPWQQGPGHHSLASYSSSASSSRRTRLPKIDLQVQVARGMMKAFQKFREFFQYEVPAAEEIFDNPMTYEVARRVGGQDMPPLQLEMDATQPTIVTHRLYWQGGEEQVPQALSVAMSSLLSHMTISNCSLHLEDIIQIITLSPSLQTFEVDRITANAKGARPSLDPTPIAQNDTSTLGAHGLHSLTLTSHVPIERVFQQIRFQNLHLLSLRLQDRGNSTNFDFIASSPLSALSRIQRFKLRGELPQKEDERLRRALRELGAVIDIICIPESSISSQ